MEKPAYYNTVMPYLIIDNVPAFLEFTEQVFGAEIKMKSEGDDGVRHAEIVIGDSTIMCGQSNEEWNPQTAGLYIHVDSADDTFQKALDAGGSTVMELADQSYGRSGGVKDPAGTVWWITSEK